MFRKYEGNIGKRKGKEVKEKARRRSRNSMRKNLWKREGKESRN